MRQSTLSAWREVLLSFMTMLAVNMLYEAVHKLRALGQSVSGMVIDSVGIATLFALLTYLVGRKKDRGSE